MNINKTPYEPHSEIQGQDSTTLKDPEQVISAVAQEDGPSRFLSQNEQVAGVLQQNYNDLMSNTPLKLNSGPLIKIQNDS